MKRCYGGGLRMQLFSFYGFPTAIAFDAAYSMDTLVKEDKNVNQKYDFGREWRYYFTLLFDFMD